MNESNRGSIGISFYAALFLLFLTLKLTGVIAWSWWWVTAPLWMPALILMAIMFVMSVVALILSAFDR